MTAAARTRGRERQAEVDSRRPGAGKRRQQGCSGPRTLTPPTGPISGRHRRRVSFPLSLDLVVRGVRGLRIVAFAAQQLADMRPVLLFDVRVVFFLVRSSSRKLQFRSLAVPHQVRIGTPSRCPSRSPLAFISLLISSPLFPSFLFPLSSPSLLFSLPSSSLFLSFSLFSLSPPLPFLLFSPPFPPPSFPSPSLPSFPFFSSLFSFSSFPFSFSLISYLLTAHRGSVNVASLAEVDRPFPG